MEQGQLHFKGRLVLPKNSTLIITILNEYHSGLMGDHSGFFKTYKRIKTELYWEGMKKDIQDFVAKCSTCQQNKYLALTLAGLLQPLPIPNVIWEVMWLDFIEGLLTSLGITPS